MTDPNPAEGPGIRLCRRFYQQIVAPLLAGVPHAAALLGPGSEVLGFDDETSPDHGFGPRVLIFVPDSAAVAFAERRLDGLDRLDGFDGMPIHFPRYDNQAPAHQVQVHTAPGYFVNELGVDPAAGMALADWLMLPAQVLRTMTAGAVFADLDGTLATRREALQWYPDDVWRYALATAWLRISQEEPFVGRAGGRGDDLGSRIVAARLARDLMKLAFLIERSYAPYSKWLGHAFTQLSLSQPVAPKLAAAIAADTWRDREAYLGEAACILGEASNDLGLAPAVDPRPRQFFSRDIRVSGAERHAVTLCEAITDPDLVALLDRLGYRHDGAVPSLPGTVDQAIDSTDVLASVPRCRQAAALLGLAGYPAQSRPIP